MVKSSLKNYSSKKNAVIALVVIGACLVLMAWAWYVYKKRAIVESYEKSLSSIAHMRSDKIMSIVNHYIAQGQQRAMAPQTRELLKQLEHANPEDLTVEKQQKLFENYATFLEEQSVELLYRNTLLIRKDGVVVYADFAPDYLGKNILKKPYADFALSASFIRSNMSITVDIADFAIDPLLNEPALYVSIPVVDDGVLLGTIVQWVKSEKIFAVTDDYIGLGKTGDTITGKKIEDGIIFLSRTRGEYTQPLKRFVPYSKMYGHPFGLALGATGMKGTGFSDDYDQTPVVAAWSYIPRLDWGITSKIDAVEVDRHIFFWKLIALLLTILWTILFSIICWRAAWTRKVIHHLKYRLEKPSAKRYLQCSWLVLTIVVLLGIMYSMHREHASLIDETKQLAKDKIVEAGEGIEYLLSDFAEVGQEIANDIAHGRLKYGELELRVARDFAERKNIFSITIGYEPYKGDPNKKLFAPSFIRSNGSYTRHQVEDSYNYLEEIPGRPGHEAETWSWYTEPLKQKQLVWFDPYKEVKVNRMVGGYSVPIFAAEDIKKEKPLGVVNVTYEMEPIEAIISRLTIATTGYAYLLSQGGIFIYYPDRRYVNEQKSIEELARERSSAELLAISEDVIDIHKSGFATYFDTTTEEQMWMFYDNIPLTKWGIVAVFSEEDVALSPLTKRHYGMALLFVLMFALFSLVWLLGGIFENLHHVRWINAILLFILVLFFQLIRMTSSPDVEGEIIIRDQIRLNQFINEKDTYAQRVHEDLPIKIPTGIYLSTINFYGSRAVDISGYIWQKFPKTIDPALIQEIDFSQAITPSQMKKIYQEKEGDSLIIGWFFATRLAQGFNYTKYPFDLIVIRLDLEFADSGKNVLFVPALADYRDIRPENAPGIGKYDYSQISGFDLKETFFSYANEAFDTNFGLKSYEMRTNRAYLTYSLVFTRSLLYDFIIIILPILIIFFCLFTIFSISEQQDRRRFSDVTTLTAYTGLIFTIIILHTTLKNRFSTSDVLYIEYLFFMLYVTFIVLVLNTLLKIYKIESPYIAKFFNFLHSYFWPLELGMLLIITAIIFSSM